MKTKLFGALVFSSLIAGQALAGDKIVGGVKVTDLKEAPYMVSLSGVCGGSIIAKNWVLTAAHCAGYFSQAKGGILNLKDQGVSYRVKRVIKHPEYNRNTFSHDFALVELTESIDFRTTGLKAVKLATPKFASEGNQAPGVDATVYGFGDIAENRDNYTKDLNKVIVPIVSHEEANRAESYDGAIDDTMIPAGYAAGGKDSCQGDSGGPLVVFDGRNDAVQIGVVSWGEGCAGANKYGVYSNVSGAYEWIKTTTGAL
ncbi:S1 family serine peptidase [Peredibacter starrii]|uniref:Serine protease n=1 Tax=Peredibacter starrii TaxID=28202 RepID=A0AAX4HJM0_9BACT|nr:serine protease [Peredibacter starrii]WPU63434.1 serine protease [Peredibacter starrii]